MERLLHSTIVAIVRKEFLKIRRDRRMLISIVFQPLIMLLLYGFGMRFDVTSVTVAILDYDQTQTSRQYLERFFTTTYFIRVDDVRSYADLERDLDSGRARLGVVIPPEFGRKIRLKEKTQVQTLVDGTDSNTASIAVGYFTPISQSFSVEVQAGRLSGGQLIPLNIEPRVWYNPDLKSSHFIVPGVIAVIMMMIGAMLTTVTIVQEKEFGSIEQLIVSPVRPIELVVGKLLPYVFFAMLDMLLIIAAAYLVFGVPIRGSFFLLFWLALLYLIGVLGIGVVVSTMADTVQAATMIAVLFTMLPATLLSGFVFPLENMPLILQGLSLLVPPRYFLEIIRGIYLKGTGLADFWPQVVFLAIFACATLAISTRRFKKRLD
jgi:ABC-2 type transport system permease protein